MLPTRKLNLEFLVEGGKATEGSRILAEYIEPTLAGFEETILKPVLDLTVDECRLVGSTGKKEDSGDIDLAIPVEQALGISNKELLTSFYAPMKKVYEEIVKLSPKSKLNLVFRQIHASTPILDPSGRETGEDVQVDMIFGDLDYLSFSLSSFPDQSKYDSWVRNGILVALARTIVIDEFEDRKVHYRIRASYNTNIGLLERVEYKFVDDVTGCPNEHLASTLITDDPQKATGILFSGLPGVKPEDTNTAESVLELIKRLIASGELNPEIFDKEFKLIAQENAQRLELPLEGDINA